MMFLYQYDYSIAWSRHFKTCLAAGKNPGAYKDPKCASPSELTPAWFAISAVDREFCLLPPPPPDVLDVEEEEFSGSDPAGAPFPFPESPSSSPRLRLDRPSGRADDPPDDPGGTTGSLPDLRAKHRFTTTLSKLFHKGAVFRFAFSANLRFPRTA